MPVLTFRPATVFQVTVEDNSVIARTGKLGMFAALRECCPSAIRSDDPFIGRHGLTEIELNKVLERNGFIKVRDRSGTSPLIIEGYAHAPVSEDGKGSKGECEPLRSWAFLDIVVQYADTITYECGACLALFGILSDDGVYECA
jgi:hypothetical protein